jgi:hypothetical protein
VLYRASSLTMAVWKQHPCRPEKILERAKKRWWTKP